MGRKRHTPEQIITALREAEVGLANGKAVAEVGAPARDQRADVLPVVLGQPRTTQRRIGKVRPDEVALSYQSPQQYRSTMPWQVPNANPNCLTKRGTEHVPPGTVPLPMLDPAPSAAPEAEAS